MKKKEKFVIPAKTISESNSSEHWVKKANRHKIQKWMVKKAFRDHNLSFTLPVEVTITRIAPKSLDSHDNLPISQKWICDQIAAEITEITWKYQQKKGKVKEYAVEVEIEEK